MVEFAVNLGAVATPLAPVIPVAVRPPLVPPVNVPLAPVDGALNVTVTPLIGFPPLSVTVAARFVANAAVTAAV
jgi:hypothetical protein